MWWANGCEWFVVVVGLLVISGIDCGIVCCLRIGVCDLLLIVLVWI